MQHWKYKYDTVLINERQLKFHFLIQAQKEDLLFLILNDASSIQHLVCFNQFYDHLIIWVNNWLIILFYLVHCVIHLYYCLSV